MFHTCIRRGLEMEHKLSVMRPLMSKYREDVLNEIAEEVERFVESKVWEIIEK